jgi:hypothetical protein
MVPAVRKAYNAQFSLDQYQAYIEYLSNVHPGQLQFRVAETPIFVDKAFTEKTLQACEDIVDVILAPNFKELTETAIPEHLRMYGENERCEFFCFDFGICQNEAGQLEPQLIEMQGFPSLFAYQILHTAATKKFFDIPARFDSYLSGYNEATYIDLLKQIIIGQHNPEAVILLEIYPEQQKTKIDFACTEAYLGIQAVCLTKLKADGRQLYYEKDGRRIDVKRIYNRLIFDDLEKQQLPEGTVNLMEDWAVEWCPHPHWFYRISKFTLPFIQSPFVPPTFFLHQLKQIPSDLENYVLKPLFSFAGQGVVIDVTPEDIAQIKDPHNWILQKKVTYADAIVTPDIPAKAEIRVFYMWPPGAERPIPAQNLGRLSKGKMIGVRYNADKEWVGGSLVFFEQ